MTADSLPPVPPLILSLADFMLVEQCPAEWRAYDLYIVRDGDVVFYVGQSYLAFDRVWQHLRDAHKGRSVIGRFLLRNWPASMHYTIELVCARDVRFAAVGHDLSAAEAALIAQSTPCFNRTLNARPRPLPEPYAPPNGPIRCSRNLNHLIREAGYARKAAQRKKLLDEIAAAPAHPKASE